MFHSVQAQTAEGSVLGGGAGEGVCVCVCVCVCACIILLSTMEKCHGMHIEMLMVISTHKESCTHSLTSWLHHMHLSCMCGTYIIILSIMGRKVL